MPTNLRSATTRPKPTKVAKMAREGGRPSEDRVRVLAYQLYDQRQANRIAGDAMADWIEAERLLANGEN